MNVDIVPPRDPGSSSSDTNARDAKFPSLAVGPTVIHRSPRETTMLVHADGTLTIVDAQVVGGDVDFMPFSYFTSPQFIGTVVAHCLANMAAFLGWVLPASTLALIDADIGPSVNIAWVATIWTMGSSIGFLLVGRLSDLFGRKWVVIITTTLGLVGCIIGGTARNVPMLIVSNGFNGLAAAGQLSFGIFLGELVPNSMRGPTVTFVFLTSLPFAVFGPVIARAFAEHTSQGWRWSYYIGIAVNSLGLVLFQLLYHPPRFHQLHVGKTRWQQAQQLDFVGILLFVSGCALFLTGLSWGGNAYPWASAHVLVMMLVGITLLAGFFFYEANFCGVPPLMPSRMFRVIGFDAVIASATVGSMVYYSLTVLWPSMIQLVYRVDSMEVGWQSSVVGGGVLLGQVLGGIGISFVPRVNYQVFAAALVVFAFMTALTSLSQYDWANTIAFGVIACAGVGYIETVAMTGVTLLWEPQDIGLASGILGSIRSLGGAVAQALFSSVFTNSVGDYMNDYVARAATQAGLGSDILPVLLQSAASGNYTGVPGMNATITAAVEAATVTANRDAFRMVFYSVVPFSAIVVFAAWFVPDMESYLTPNVARKLQHDKIRRGKRGAVSRVFELV